MQKNSTGTRKQIEVENYQLQDRLIDILKQKYEIYQVGENV